MNVGIADIRNNLADTLNRAIYGGERVVLERRGKPVAAIVSLEDLALIEELDNRSDLRAARKARQQGGKPVPLAKIKARLGMK